MKKYILLISILFSVKTYAQETNINNIDYSSPKIYEIGGVTISGAKYLDSKTLLSITGLTIGDEIEIPGEKIANSISNLWKQILFSDIQINIQNYFYPPKYFMIHACASYLYIYIVCV